MLPVYRIGLDEDRRLFYVMNQITDPPRRTNWLLPRDLNAVCLKALHKEPSRRYADAGLLADDLRAHLEGRPVAANRPNPVQRLSSPALPEEERLQIMGELEVNDSRWILAQFEAQRTLNSVTELRFIRTDPEIVRSARQRLIDAIEACIQRGHPALGEAVAETHLDRVAEGALVLPIAKDEDEADTRGSVRLHVKSSSRNPPAGSVAVALRRQADGRLVFVGGLKLRPDGYGSLGLDASESYLIGAFHDINRNDHHDPGEPVDWRDGIRPVAMTSAQLRTTLELI